jgi:hypothetical protein
VPPRPAIAAATPRLLDEAQIVATLRRLRDRIEERFPGSGLGGVSADVLAIGNETAALVAYLARPNWPIRIAVGVAILVMAVVLVALASSLASRGLGTGIDGVGAALQASESLINDVVFLGVAIFFLVSLETRAKRRRALGALHRLRSMAHIVDMHQLTKDPDRIRSPESDTASSPERDLSPAELGRYLDYCSELLSVISKLAALHAQQFNDSVTLAAVNEVETLCTGLSNKIWQKITLIERR